MKLLQEIKKKFKKLFRSFSFRSVANRLTETILLTNKNSLFSFPN